MTTRPDDLVLYVTRGCGYCADVREEARALGLELEEREAWREPEHLEALMAARGRRTVPVLRIRREGGDEWMGESTAIIAYLHERFGEGGAPPRWRRWASHRAVTVGMWGLLLGGGLASEPARSALWTAACALATARSLTFALRSGSPVHWAIAAAFASGAVSIPLHALGVVDFPWWYVAFAAAGLAALLSWVRARGASSAR